MNKKEKIFATTAGILAILSVFFGFITWCYSQMVPFIVHSDLISGYSFVIQFIKAVITPLLSQIIGYLPAVLFAIYALFLYRKNKNSKLLPISFVFAIISVVISMATNLYSAIMPLINGSMPVSLGIKSLGTTFIFSIVALILNVALAVDGFANFKLSVISRIAVVLKLIISLGVVCIWLLNFLSVLLDGHSWQIILISTAGVPSSFAALIFPIALVIFYFGCVKKPKKEEVPSEVQIQE